MESVFLKLCLLCLTALGKSNKLSLVLLNIINIVACGTESVLMCVFPKSSVVFRVLNINNVSIHYVVFFDVSVAVISGGKMKIVEEPNTFGSGFQQTLYNFHFKYEIYLYSSSYASFTGESSSTSSIMGTNGVLIFLVLEMPPTFSSPSIPCGMSPPSVIKGF